MRTKKTGKVEIIVVVSIIAIALLMMAFMTYFSRTGNSVEIKLDGVIYKTVSLSSNIEVNIDDKCVLKIRNGTANMITANCKDQICVKHKSISELGETITCLPNGITVTVVSSSNDHIGYEAW